MAEETNNSHLIVERLAKTSVVVLLEVSGKLTPYLEPGLNRVWSGKGIFGRRMGDEIVKECRAEGFKASVMTWEDAVRLLTKQCGGDSQIEKELYDRIVNKNLQRANLKQLPK